MNGTAPTNHTRFIVFCITFLGAISIICGSFLLWKGFQSGELLVSSGGVGAIAGLVGFLSGKPPAADTVKISNTDANPVPVTDQHKDQNS